MLNVITFKGLKNRGKFIDFSEQLRKKKVFHRARLVNDNICVIHYTNNVRGLEKLQEEE